VQFRLKKVQGKKKRDNATKESERAGFLDDEPLVESEDTPANLLADKDEDVIF
jgi:V-type H+-transporting ATPase subunit D